MNTTNNSIPSWTTVDQTEKDFWQSYAKIYHHLEKADPYQDLLRTIEELVKPKENEYWLDIGTGSGAIINMLLTNSKNKIGKILAIDSEDVMLQHALKRKTEKVEFQNVNLLDEFPFEENIFDGIVANLVIPYIYRFQDKPGAEALKSLLANIYHSLKENGVLVWSTPVKNVNFFKVFLASWKNILDPRHMEHLFYGPAIFRYALKIQRNGKTGLYNFLTQEELGIIHKEIGFKDIEFKKTFADQVLVVKAKKY